MWLLLVIVSVVPSCLFVRDRIAEMVRRRREPRVEAEVKRRMAANYDPIPRPATPDVRMPNLHEWLTADPETYPINRVRPVAAMWEGFFVVCLVCAIYVERNVYYAISLPLVPIVVGGSIYTGLHKPSLVWRVRRGVRISSVARKHGAEFVEEDIPGQGWDLTQVRNRVGQVTRDWDKGVQLDGSFLPKGGSDDPAQTGGTTSILDVKPVEAIRSACHPCFEYGMEKPKHDVFRFYIVAETLALPYFAVRRRRKMSARRQRRAVASSQIDQIYTVVTGCEDAYSRLSRRTKEMMVGVHVDKMVLYQGWAVLWWDSEIDWTLTFGGQNWDGGMDLASEKTWEGVKKVRSLLTSIENGAV